MEGGERWPHKVYVKLTRTRLCNRIYDLKFFRGIPLSATWMESCLQFTNWNDQILYHACDRKSDTRSFIWSNRTNRLIWLGWLVRIYGSLTTKWSCLPQVVLCLIGREKKIFSFEKLPCFRHIDSETIKRRKRRRRSGLLGPLFHWRRRILDF